MKIPLAFLADAAVAHPDGKLSALGCGIDCVNATQFPIQLGNLAVVVKVEFAPVECERPHLIEVLPLDADGKPFSNALRQQVTPSRNALDPTLPSAAQAILNYVGLSFAGPSEYAFSVVVDGQEMASLPLRVIRAPALTGGIAPSAS